MVSLRAFWVCTLAAAMLGFALSLAVYVTVLPHERNEGIITYCFSTDVEIRGFGPMTDRDRQIVKDCGYGDRLVTPSPP